MSAARPGRSALSVIALSLLSWLALALLPGVRVEAGDVLVVAPPGSSAGPLSIPLSTANSQSRQQAIYLASEIGNSGTIDSLALSIVTPPTGVMGNFTIRIKPTAATTFTANWGDASNWTTVYSASTSIGAAGFHTFAFTTPYTYNGTDNLIIDFSFQNGAAAAAHGTVDYISFTNRTLYYRDNGAAAGAPTSWVNTTPAPNLGPWVPIIRLNFHVPRTLYAKPTATGTGTGLSWANASTLATALATASFGDQIWVQAGTHKPTTGSARTSSFVMKHSVAIYGGFNGTETLLSQRSFTNETTLSGNIGNVLLSSDNTYNVVVGANNAIVDGFVIRQGQADGGSFGSGGGGLVTNGSLSISNCVFVNNDASYAGGAIFINTGSSTISNCVFVNNGSATCSYGGAIEDEGGGNTVIRNSTFYNNVSQNGGAIEVVLGGTMTFTNCILWGNDSLGEEIYNNGGKTVVMTNCVIKGGTAQAALPSGIFTDGGGNTAVDPQYLNTADFDGPDNTYGTVDDGLFVIPGGSAYNTGISGGASTDIGGRARPSEGGIDIGAYERISARTFYVNPSAAGSGNGLSWANAFTDLATALPYAATNDQVWVAQGTYKPPATRASSFLPRGAQIYGGFIGTETLLSQRNWVTRPTILSGDIGTVGDTSDNCYHVLEDDHGSIIDGFTVRDANCNGGYPDNVGGGLYSLAATTLRNCAFIQNTGSWGPAFSFENGPVRMVQNCFFADNTSTSSGNGGAGYIQGTTSATTIANSVFANNTTGGGSGGGAIWLSGSATFIHTSFSGNAATIGSGGAILGGTPAVTNCIFWGNTASGGAANQIATASSASSTNTLFQGGLPSGFTTSSGTRSSDPRFVNAFSPAGADGIFATGDDGLVLGGGSPAINAGVSTAYTTDVLGNARPLEGGIDLGPYEVDIIYVNTAAAGANNGSSWANAYTLVQSALAAGTPGCQIWVAQGTYKPTTTSDRNISFTMTKGCGLYGGFLGNESVAQFDNRNWSTRQTILSGDIGTAGVLTDNSIHVVLGASAPLNGFIVRDGYADGSGGTNESMGGGVFSDGGPSPVIANCFFTNNHAPNYTGGALLYRNAPTPRLTNCVLTGNTAAYGGALFCWSGTTLNVLNCTFSVNSASNSGGAFYSYPGATVSFRNSILWGDSSSSGQEIYPGGGNSTLTNCTAQGITYNATTMIDGGGNLAVDPLFAVPGTPAGTDGILGTSDDGLRLLASSPAVNGGTSSGLDIPTVDVLVAARPIGGSIDMGAYEGKVGEVAFKFSALSNPESTTSTTIPVSLTAASDLTVTVNYAVTGGSATGADFTLASGTLTFTPGVTSQNIPLTVVDDAIAEVDETIVVGLSGPTNAIIGSPSSHTYTIQNNDAAGVTVTPTSGLVTTEAGGTAAFTVRLNSQPTATVTIAVTSSNTGEGTVSASSLGFDAGNWSTNQTVTITGVNDSVDDGDIAYTIILGQAASSDGFYSPINPTDVTVTNTDNDTAGFTVSAISGNTTEAGGTATFTVILTSQPTQPVDIDISSSNTAEGTVAPIKLTFTAADWNNAAAHTVTVTGQDDQVDDDNVAYTVVTANSVSSDPLYSNKVVPDVTVTNVDNDIAGVSLAQNGAPLATTVTEGGATDTYNLVLDTKPTSNVTITVTADAQAQVSVVTSPTPASSKTLTFTNSNWNSPQAVTVTSVDDAVSEASPHNALISHASSSSDGKYNGAGATPPGFRLDGGVIATPYNLAAAVTDNDSAGYVIALTGGSIDVTEAGGTDTFTVRLNTQPTAGVALTLTANGQVALNGGAAGNSVVLAFTTLDWNVPQDVTVGANNDALIEGSPHSGAITGSVSGGGYTNVAAPFTALATSITDNDTGSVTIAQTGGTAVSESGGTDTYTVVLGVQPATNVTITVSSGSQLTVDKPTLTFTNADWNTAQTITVSAVNDLIAEGTHNGTITHSASGSGYNTATFSPGSSVVATITDNDTAAVTIDTTGMVAVPEANTATTATYVVRLATQPTSTVTVTLTPNAQVTVDTNGAGAGTPNTLVFTTDTSALSGNTGGWNQDHFVTVAAVNDTTYEDSPHAGQITHSASSADGFYNGITIAQVSPSVTDNDTAPTVGFSAATSQGPESTTAVNLTVTLSAASGRTTTVAYAVGGGSTANNGGADSDFSVSGTALTFNPGVTSQSVPLTIVNDSVDEDNETVVITLSAPTNATLGTASHTYTIQDNDTAGLIIAQSGGTTNVAEDADADVTVDDTYTIRLASAPLSTETITVTIATSGGTSADLQLIADMNTGVGGNQYTRTFTSANWSTPVTVNVLDVDDAISEGTHTGSLVHSSAGNAKYLALPNTTMSVTITDNDGNVTISALSQATTESGTTATYTIGLNTPPTAPVTITATPNSQVTVDNGSGGNSVTFNTGETAAKTITVTAVDDNIVEGTHTGLIAHNATGAPEYNGVGIVSALVTITDNDTPTVTIVESDGATTVAEGGDTDNYTVTLGKQPTGTVVITVLHDAQVSVSPAALIFTPANFATPQTVTVTAADDAIDETASHSGDITHAASGSGWDAAVIAGVTAVVADNDTAGVAITQSLGTTQISEAGATDTYTVVLTSQPTGTVRVHLAVDAQLQASVTDLDFTTADYNTPQTVTVTAVNDLTVEGTHTGTITHTVIAPTSDANYLALSGSVVPVVATITDNDTAGITVGQTGGSTSATEGGGGDLISVVLTAQPTADVSLTVAAGGGQLLLDTVPSTGSAASKILTFTATNWSTTQTVTVVAVDDALAEGAHLGPITLSATAGGFTGVSSSLNVAITDNDTASVIITQSGGTTAIAEGGATDTYSVRLGSQPTGLVVVTINAGAQASVSPSFLTFHSGNWNDASAGAGHVVTVTAINDLVSEATPHTATVAHTVSSGDTSYDGLAAASVAAAVADNDTAAIIVSPTSGLATTEAGGTATFTVRLATQPASNVVVALTSSDTGEGRVVVVEPLSLTFTNANWNTAQTVTVTGADDLVSDGDQLFTVITAPATGDPRYTGIDAENVSVVNHDDDTPGITLIETGGTAVAEAGATSDTYGVVLDTEPSTTITVTLTPDAQVTVVPTTLTFTPANWNDAAAHQVTVTAVNDSIDEAASHTGVVNHSASGGEYAGINTTLSVTVTDDDTAGFTVSAISGSTSEVAPGNAPVTATFTVALNTTPTAVVTVILSSSNTNEGTVSPSTMTFTAANVAQTVTVTGIDDLVDDGDIAFTIDTQAVSADSAYSVGTSNATGLSDVSVTNLDNDLPAVVLSTTTLTTTEATGLGHSTTFTISLGTQPVGPVTIAFSGIDTAEGGISSTSVAFTSSDWNIAKTLTITGVDDALDDGDQGYTIVTTVTASAATDPGYNGFALADIGVTNVDDDVAGFVVSPSVGLVTTETGGTAIFSVRLTSQPYANVTITLQARIGGVPNTSEGDVTSPVGHSLVFTSGPSGNWNVPQTVTITGANDSPATLDGDRPYTIVTAVSAGDAAYLALDPTDVSVTNDDDDVPVVVIAQTAGGTAVAEPTGSDGYTIVLSSRPLNGVTITVTTDGSVSASPSTLTFTTADSGAGSWSVPQTVTVTAIDDEVAQGDYVTVITHAASDTVVGQVSAYAGVSIAPVSVSVSDDDNVGIVVSTLAGGPVTEIGGSATFTIALDSEPTAPVVINLASSDTAQGTVSPASLIFTQIAYGPQTVTITGADGNGIDDGPQLFTVIIVAAASTDGSYDGLDPADVAVTNLAVNNQPTLNAISPLTIAEDSVGQTVNLSGIGPGQGGESFALSSAATVTAVSSDQAVIPNASLVITYAVPAATGTLVLTPSANVTGTTTITVTIDDGGATINGGQRTVTRSFTVTVNGVNDPPSFVKGPNQSVAEDSGVTTVANWATSILAGPADEVLAGQTLTFNTSTSNDALFAALPTITAAGTLSFQPAADAAGVATVTVTLSDDGGGTSTSAGQTFTITVTPVNDAPIFTAGPDQIISEDAGAQTVTPWATGIAPGPLNESAQTVSFVVTANSNAALFSVAPAISANGTLTYTPLANASGTANITYHLHDSALADSADQVLTITVNAVNDAPVPAVSLPAGRTVPIGTPRVIPTGDLSATDVDSAVPHPAVDPALTITVQLPPGQGTLLRDADANLVTTGDQTTMGIGSTFSQGDIQNGRIFYRHNGGSGTSDGFAFIVTDSGIGALPAASSPLAVFNITIDRRAPVITLPAATLDLNENEPSPTLFATGIGVTVVDDDFATSAPNGYQGATLTVGFSSGGTANDHLDILPDSQITVDGSNGVLYNSVLIATYSGEGTAAMLFNLTSSADPGAVLALIRRLTILNDSEAPAVAPAKARRVVSVVLVDNNGDTSQPATRDIDVQSVNDAPVITSPFTYATADNVALLIPLTATDADGDTVTFTLVTNSESNAIVTAGTVVNTFLFTPLVPTGFGSFDVLVSDSYGYVSTPQNISVAITPDASARPWITSDPPLDWPAGLSLTINLKVEMATTSLTYQVIGLSPSQYNLQATGAGDTATLTLFPTTMVSGYLIFGVLVTDTSTLQPSSGHAGFQPITISVDPIVNLNN